MKLDFDFKNFRWFMGKGKEIQASFVEDTFLISGVSLFIYKVLFSDGTFDFYSVFENEKEIEFFLKGGFSGEDEKFSLESENGFLTFEKYRAISPALFQGIKQAGLEQSNSSFFNPGKVFFKLYRRLLNGKHPEPEILKTLDALKMTPELLGTVVYRSKNENESFTVGILETHIENTVNGFDLFCKKMDENFAALLGEKTSFMHESLKNLDGNANISSEIPFENLEKLLKKTVNEKENTFMQTTCLSVLKKLPQIKAFCKNSARESDLFKPQRIHGDFHLGQILFKNADLWILDFEGEVLRPLDYRRRLTSPLVDLASMLRSFDYAAAISKANASLVKKMFLENYAKNTSVCVSDLEKYLKREILAKAVYEACYELEYRPSWFKIPAEVLIEF